MSVCPASKNTSLSAGSSTNSWLLGRPGSPGAGTGGGGVGAVTPGAERGGGAGAGCAGGAAATGGGGVDGAEVWVGAVCSAHPASVKRNNARHSCHPRWVLMSLPSFEPRRAALVRALGVNATETDKR